MENAVNSIGEALISIGETFTIWVTLPIIFAFGLKEYFRRKK